LRIPLKEGIGVTIRPKDRVTLGVTLNVFLKTSSFLCFLEYLLLDGWDFDIFCAVWIQLAIFLIGFTYLFLILYLNKLHYLEINVSETLVV